MDFREFARFLRAYVWLLLVTVVLGAGTAVTLAVTLPKSYTATSQVLFSTDGRQTGQNLDLAGQYLILRMPTYSELVRSRAVLDPVISTLGLHTSYDVLRDDVSTSVAAGTTVISISVSQPTARRAQSASLTVAQSLIQLVSANGNPTTGTATDPGTARIVTSPPLPSAASSPAPRPYVVGGVLLGLVVGLAIGLVHWLRRRWRVPSPTQPASVPLGSDIPAAPVPAEVGSGAPQAPGPTGPETVGAAVTGTPARRRRAGGRGRRRR